MPNAIDSAQRRDPSHETEAARRTETAPQVETNQKQGRPAAPSYAYHPSQDAAIRAFVTSVKEQIGAGVTHVERDHDGDATIRIGRRSYDLSTAEGREGFTAVLRAKGLTSERADLVMRVIGNAPPSSRDELAALALAWANAERGGGVQKNLSIEAGVCHSDLWALAEAMPRAAAQVEHVEVHGDASVHGEIANRSWRDVFPSLQRLETVSRFERSSAVRA